MSNQTINKKSKNTGTTLSFFHTKFSRKFHKMSGQITKNDFPNEIMTKILGFLDQKSILHAILAIQFDNLRSLHIQRLTGKIDWNRFTKINSRLTELAIEKIMNEALLSSDDIENITTNVSLHTLRLGAGFKGEESFFEIIRNKCPDLKMLDLHKSCVTNEPKRHSERNMFRLCDVIEWPKHLSIWNEDDYDGKLQYFDDL